MPVKHCVNAGGAHIQYERLGKMYSLYSAMPCTTHDVVLAGITQTSKVKNLSIYDSRNLQACLRTKWSYDENNSAPL